MFSQAISRRSRRDNGTDGGRSAEITSARAPAAGAVLLAFLATDVVSGVVPGLLGLPVRVTLALLAFAVALPRTRGLALAIALAVLALGAAIAQAESLWDVWLRGTVALAPVLAIVTFAGLLATSIEMGRYNAALVAWLERGLPWRGARFQVAVLASFVLGWLTAGAALAASYGALTRADDDAGTRDALVRNSMRGVGAAVAMTPVTGAFGVSIAMTGVAPLTVVALALPVAVLIVILALVAARTDAPSPPPSRPHEPGRALWEPAVALAALVLVVGSLGAIGRVGPLYSIVLGILVVSGAWMLLLDPHAARERWRRFPRQVAETAPSYSLFIAAGALAAVVGAGTWRVWLGNGLISLSAFVPPALAIAGTIWLLFQIGVHPAVSIGVIAPVALHAGLASPTLTALAGVLAAGIGVVSSPFGVVAGLASGITRRSIFEVSVGWHFVFGAVALVLGSLLAQLLA